MTPPNQFDADVNLNVSAAGLTESEIAALLETTSRTFALTIPLLPKPLRRYVGLAYLLFRIADTIEDGEHAGQREKQNLFERLQEALSDRSRNSAIEQFSSSVAQQPLTASASDKQLLDMSGRTIRTLTEFPDAVATIIVDGVFRSAKGMNRFVAAGDRGGNVRLKSMVELREYCYSVAGIVGEMLTDLFLLESDISEDVAGQLRSLAPVFGEALQLVNIVKDDEADERQGRRFVPPGVDRGFLISLARHDLEESERYTDLLKQNDVAKGIVRFCDLPVRLAWRALERVEEDGPGAKVSRLEVARIVAAVIGPKMPFTG